MSDTSMENSGVSTETLKHINDENANLRDQLAALKAKTEVYDAQKRESLCGMKPDVTGFIQLVASENPDFKHELSAMSRWSEAMETGDALDTSNPPPSPSPHPTLYTPPNTVRRPLDWTPHFLRVRQIQACPRRSVKGRGKHITTCCSIQRNGREGLGRAEESSAYL